MPWCPTCDRFYNPNSLHADGTCPTCEQVVAEPSADDAPPGVPWHFKVLVGATVVYLGWRAVQGIAWVAQHV